MLAEDRAEDKKQETSTSVLKSELLGMLKPGENVWQAIKRLGSKGLVCSFIIENLVLLSHN